MKPEDKPRIQTEVRHRVVGRHAADLAETLFETAYQEDKRLDDEPRNAANKDAKAFWKGVQQRAVKAAPAEQRSLLHEIVQRFLEEITGNFDERVYRLSTKVIPYGLSVLLNAISPRQLLREFPRLPSLKRVVERLYPRGEIEPIKGLIERGTVILCPTHSSNLDSLILGWTIYSMGLPPFTYGAGLNLFDNPFLSYFMHNLGAYKVDRKKRHNKLYLEILKEYCTCSMELGYHNLFFPGGTRSRSGRVEEHLKLGLLGCGLTAYIHNLRSGASRPRVFIVPCTLNYPIVLEAATLIFDALKSEGRSKFIITDDEFSRINTVLSFIESFLGLDSSIELRFGHALDPFGNRVLPDGTSVDERGRPIDIERYLLRDGQIVEDRRRDAEYTRDLGVAVGAAYKRDTVIFPTHVVARAAWESLCRANPGMDKYHLIRTGGKSDSLERRVFEAEVGDLLERLRGLEQKGVLCLSEQVRQDGPEQLLERGVAEFLSYHRPSPLRLAGSRVVSDSRQLLYYYSNRLHGYGLGEGILA